MSKVGTGEKKYIIIPEAYPLYAMVKIYGPKTGPLAKPTPVPVKIIGELLQQSGKDKLTIYEVVPTNTDKVTGRILQFSEPIQLSLENYALPYEEIVKGHSEPDPIKVEPVKETPKVIVEPKTFVSPAKKEEPKPEIDGTSIMDKLNPVAVETTAKVEQFVKPNEDEATVAASSEIEEVKQEEAPAEPVAEIKPEEPVERVDDDTTEEVATSENLPWPDITPEELEAYNKMSKYEKKQARRAHRTT